MIEISEYIYQYYIVKIKIKETDMENLLKCKACDYIIAEKDLKDVCPACGVPRAAFEPYKEKANPKRMFILNLNLHPISLHFPQAITFFIPLLLLTGMLTDLLPLNDALISSKILAYIFPLSVLATFASGALDGKTRFKKFTTPALKKKLMLGSVLIILSILVFFMFYNNRFEGSERYLIFALLGASLACEVFLAQIGKKLMGCRLGG